MCGRAKASASRGEQEEDDDGDSGEGGEVSGGEGAAALAVVAAVGFDVEEVVDDVGGGGAEAEGEEGDEGAGMRAGAPGPCQAWASRRGRKMRVFLAHWWRRMALSQALSGVLWSRKMCAGVTWAARRPAMRAGCWGWRPWGLGRR